MTKLLTTVDVAEWLNCSAETVLRWQRANRIPGGARMPGGELRFDPDVIKQWIADGGATAPPKRGKKQAVTA